MSDQPVDRIIDFDGAERDKQEAQGRDVEFRKAQRKALLLRLLNDPVARDWLRELLTEFGAFGSILAASPTGFPDPYGTMYHQGRHSCGWRLWCELDDTWPELASAMRRETIT